jgi:hypothetical protein
MIQVHDLVLFLDFEALPNWPPTPQSRKHIAQGSISQCEHSPELTFKMSLAMSCEDSSDNSLTLPKLAARAAVIQQFELHG